MRYFILVPLISLLCSIVIYTHYRYSDKQWEEIEYGVAPRYSENHARIWCHGGFPQACAALASHALNRGDRTQAVKYLKTACAHNVLKACVLLATIEATNQQVEIARDRLQFACEGGLADGCAALGSLQLRMQLPLENNFFKACKMGSQSGCYKHGLSLIASNQSQDGLYFINQACKDGFTLACIYLLEKSSSITAPAPVLTCNKKETPTSCYALARQEEKLGRMISARNLYNEICWKKKFSQGCIELARLERTRGDLVAAERHLLFASSQKSWWAHWQLGQFYFDMGRKDEALTHATSACQSEQAPEACYLAGLILTLTNDHERGHALLKQSCNRGSLRGCELEAQQAYLRKDWDTGETFARRTCLLSLGSLDPMIRMRGCNTLGLIMEERYKNDSQAEKFYALACNGDLGAACTNLAKLHWRRGNITLARVLFKKSIAMNKLF